MFPHSSFTRGEATPRAYLYSWHVAETLRGQGGSASAAWRGRLLCRAPDAFPGIPEVHDAQALSSHLTRTLPKYFRQLTPGENGTRTPVRAHTPIQREEKEESPTIADPTTAVASAVPATMVAPERVDTPEFVRSSYLHMSGMSSW